MLTRDLTAAERPLAVKLLLPEYRDSTSEFMREYAVQRRLDHPAIPKVYDFGFGHHAGREVPYFAMDYVRGIPLSNALLQLRDPAAGFSWILQVLRGLDHVHRSGFLHRDLKPSNILVTWDGAPEESAHLIDFGIAIPFDETPEELFIGTPEYSAPELMAGSPFDARQDLYAIGLLLYELVTGQRPWQGEDPTDLYNKRMYGTYARVNHASCSPALARLIDDLLRPSPEHRPKSAAEVIERFTDAIGQPAPIETPFAFRRRLQTVLFEESEDFENAAAAWLGEGAAPHPVILLLEDPPGFDGTQLVHELTDRAAVAGARVIRYQLEPRPHGPLEAIEPVMALLRRLREARGGAPTLLGGLAGAATMLTRLPGSMVIAIEGIGWADTLTLELLTTIFTGARNPGLRIIATVDPRESPVAERAFERLRTLPATRYVARAPLSLDAVTDWIDLSLGSDLVPEDRIERIWEKSEGRPQRVRELLTEDLRRGALVRLRDGFRWDHATATATSGDMRDGRARPPSQPMLPATFGSTSMDDLVAALVEPVPEGVVSTFFGIPSTSVRRMVADGVLSRNAAAGSTEGWISVGPRGPGRPHREAMRPEALQALHERLARAIELALPFDGKAERAAHEWLRSNDPLRAVPHLLEAAQRASLPRQGDILPRAAALLDDARKVLEAQEKFLARAKDAEHLADRLRGLRLDLGAARVRLARALGDWPSWQRAATDLFERALETAHVPTMEVALDALMQLAADRGADDDMLRHARSLSELSKESAWAMVWARARIDHGAGRPDLALGRLREALAAGESLVAERRIQLLRLECEITTQLGWLAEGSVAVRLLGELAQRLSDRHAVLWTALYSAILLREAQAPHEALRELMKLGSELGDDRFYRLDGRIELELARAHIELGWYTTAREHLAQAVALARRDGDAETLLLARLTDARVVATLGRPERAFHQVELARDDIGGVPRTALRELEFAELEVALAGGGGASMARVFEAARRLAEAAEAEQQRGLAVRSLALATRAAIPLEEGDEALRLSQHALDRAAQWGGVGLARHQLLFLLARARHVRREGFRARRTLGQAKAQLHQVARLFTDATQRAAFLGEPNNARIDSGDLGAPGPLSRRLSRTG